MSPRGIKWGTVVNDGGDVGGTAVVDELDLFAGTFTHGLDPKGRVVLPAPFRSGFGAHAMVLPGADHIAVYPVPVFKDFIDNIGDLGDGSFGTVAMRERLTQVAQNVAIDSQGRVVIPSAFRAHFEIDGNVRVVGCYDHVGIYPDAPDTFDDIQSFMAGVGRTRAK